MNLRLVSKLQWFLLVATLLFPLGGGCADPLPPLIVDIPEYEKVMRQLKRIGKGDPIYFVSMGRSLTPIHAYLRATGQFPSCSVPLTGFRAVGELTVQEETKLFDHFDRFFPTDAAAKGHKVVIADHPITGATSRETKKYVSKYLLQRGRKLNVEFALTIPHESDIRDPVGFQPLRVGGKLSGQLADQAFDEFAEFPEFDLAKDHSETLKVKPIFQKLVDHIRRERNTQGCIPPFVWLGAAE